MRVAAIDMGTNTFHLLIVELKNEQIEVLQKISRFVYIGKGGINDGKLTSEAFERALNTLKEFRQSIDSCQVPNSNIMAVATSAIRSAKNGKELTDKIFEQTQIQVQVISGEQEASLIYEGVRKAVSIPANQTALIMDIGGGSVEFIISTSEKMLWKQSFEIGAQRLYDQFHHQEPISKNSITSLEKYLDEILQPLWEATKSYHLDFLIGSAGTFNTLREMHLRAYHKEMEEAYLIPNEDFQKIHFSMIPKNREERLLIDGMVEKRVDMIVVASCLLHFVMQKLQLPYMRISTASLREGVMRLLLSKKDLQR
jgi:exopolyphosphatase/guanosine-5'-triphosphate,3'-diphosphate pyrophosphatase